MLAVWCLGLRPYETVPVIIVKMRCYTLASLICAYCTICVLSFKSLRETCYGTALFIHGFEHYLTGKGFLWKLQQSVYLIHIGCCVWIELDRTYQTTRVRCPFELAKESCLKLAVGMVVAIKWLKNLVKALVHICPEVMKRSKVLHTLVDVCSIVMVWPDIVGAI
jgi:hypothetical protein